MAMHPSPVRVPAHTITSEHRLLQFDREHPDDVNRARLVSIRAVRSDHVQVTIDIDDGRTAPLRVTRDVQLWVLPPGPIESDDLSGRRAVSEAEAADVAAAARTPNPRNPTWVAWRFLTLITSPVGVLQRSELTQLVTPESLAAWGDFTAARDAVRAIDDRGYSNTSHPAKDAPDVRYLAIYRGVEQSFQSTIDTIAVVPASLALIWRPEFDSWLIHSINFTGSPSPDALPRTAPPGVDPPTS